ncbi:alpha/beta hydrolase fold domain-containing protein [Planctomicrobium sp. SH661]|uniref:alpha/beta hydrolase fold domain-containing protein n=1 Tax=Planctomicrobium sp. SH661 TaxID=3448124 RepID=UPI003F5BE6CF
MNHSLIIATLLILNLGSVCAGETVQEIQPTHSDVAYGPHQRNTLDFWQASGDGPRPLLVYIHGGGWAHGDKKDLNGKWIPPFLNKGISVASINYRLSGDAALPAPVHDAARAVQFLRSKAVEWNINKDRIGLNGGSAGACTAMWLLLHDDLADPHSADPVLRESTRVTAAAASAGQTSIDPRIAEEWLGPIVLRHYMLSSSVGESTIESALAHYDKHLPFYLEFSPINHVDGHDPPLFMSFDKDMTLPPKDVTHAIHHGIFGVKMKEQSDRVGHECYLLIPGTSQPKEFNTSADFLMAKLLN